MHFHLPKPLHGWREFVGDVGIIVIGILIALGGEQVVERLHDRTVRNETREAARSELQTALDRFVNRRLIQGCINRRLDQIGALLQASTRPDYTAPTWIGRPQIWGFNASAWDAANAGGRVALLSLHDQTILGALYDQLREFASLEREEQDSWADLRQLENLRVVDPQTRSTVRSALGRAKLLNWNIRVDLEQTLDQAQRLGVVHNVAARSASPSICLPLDTPRAKAIDRVNAFFGDELGEP